MPAFTPPPEVDGDALAAELADAGYSVEPLDVEMAGDDLMIYSVDESDRDGVQDVVDSHTVPPPPPDVAGLKLALFDATEGIGRKPARQLARDYPDLLDALNYGNWSLVRAGVDEAHTDGALTDSQHQTVLDLLDAHHVP